MPTLSLTLIVKNEEIHLPQVLANAKLFADEIVIVDTGSTDATKEIARQYTDRLIDFEWCDDFAKARNAGLAACQMDYVLWLDADDVIAEADSRRLRELVDGPKDWDVLMIPYHYGHDSEGRTTAFHFRERLFDRRLGMVFEFPVHECLRFLPDLRIGFTHEIKIVHHNLKRTEPSNVRNLRILWNAVETDEYRNEFRMWWLLAREEGPEKGILLFHKVLADFCTQPGFSPTLHGQVWYELGQKYDRLERWDKALEAFGRAIVLYPLWREPFFWSGKMLWCQQRYREALGMFRIAGSIPRPPSGDFDGINPQIYDGEEYYEWLFVTYQQLGDMESARTAIAHGIQANPRSPVFQRRCQEYGVPAGSDSKADDAATPSLATPSAEMPQPLRTMQYVV